MSRSLAIKADGTLTWEKPPHKYGAQAMMVCLQCCGSWPTFEHVPGRECCGHAPKRFDSKREASRYAELRMLVAAGLIRDLAMQPRYEMRIGGELICTYIADYLYTDVATGRKVIEDAKSPATRTPVYRLKKKLLKVLHGITVVEV